MNNKWHLGSKAKSITVGTKLAPVSKIILKGKNNQTYTAGTDIGYVLEIDVPNATQQMANDLLKKAQGFEYQGYTANTAYVPPEIELGDGVETKGVYGIVARREYSFTPKITENISAPYSSEDHEFQYTGTYKKMLDSKVEFDTSYGGFSIDRYDGISVSDFSGGLSMYQDHTTGQLILTDKVNVDRAFSSSHTHSELVKSLDRLDQSIHALEVTDYSLVSQIGNVQSDVSRLEQTTSSLSSTIKSAQGDISRLEQTATSLSSEIRSVDGHVSRVEQTASSLSSEIKNTKGDVSRLQQTATSLTSDIKDAKGNISSLQQTAKSLSSDIQDAEGNISSLQQTAVSLSSQISDAKGNISKLQQTTTSLSSSISDTNKNVSSIEQYAKSITLAVTNGKESSTIQLKAGSTTIASKDIQFTGMVTFNDLEGNGTTKINGANITTGKISADRIDVDSLKVNRVYAGSSTNLAMSTGSSAIYFGLGSTYKTYIQGTGVEISSTGTVYLGGSITKIGSGGKIGFFGSSGSSKQTVSKASTSASLSATIGCLNSLITALKAYGLV